MLHNSMQFIRLHLNDPVNYEVIIAWNILRNLHAVQFFFSRENIKMVTSFR